MGDKVRLGIDDPNAWRPTEGPKTSQLPANFISVDFTLEHKSKLYPMGMKAGIIASKESTIPNRHLESHVGFSMFYKDKMPPDAKPFKQGHVTNTQNEVEIAQVATPPQTATSSEIDREGQTIKFELTLK